MSARRLAATMWTVTLLGVGIGVTLLVANRTTAVPVSPIGYNGSWSFAALTFTAFVFASVGALVASRHPRNAIGWLFCGVGILGTAELIGSQYAIYGLLTAPGSLPRPELGAWVYEWTGFVAASLTATFVLLLFPDGRLPSRAWRPALWVSGLGTVVGVVALAFRPGRLALSAFVENPFGLLPGLGAVVAIALLGLSLMLVGLVLSGASLVVRYRRVDVRQRLQIKWIAYIAGLHAAAFVVLALLLSTSEIATPIVALIGSAIPIAMAIAILRHRLYDIDLLIKRTVVYGATSVAIGLTFFLGILALQALLRPLTAGSEIAIAASTLGSLALFQPIRRRVQDAVNRRFDRTRYDAARTVDAFADQLRDEVDLDALRVDLLGTVNRTMAPAHASLWLRDRGRG